MGPPLSGAPSGFSSLGLHGSRFIQSSSVYGSMRRRVHKLVRMLGCGLGSCLFLASHYHPRPVARLCLLSDVLRTWAFQNKSEEVIHKQLDCWRRGGQTFWRQSLWPEPQKGRSATFYDTNLLIEGPEDPPPC